MGPNKYKELKQMGPNKYIVIEYRGDELPILFNPLMEHDMFYKIFADKLIISAGFFKVENQPSTEIKVSVWGWSISLNKYSRQEDCQLIEKLLQEK